MSFIPVENYDDVQQHSRLQNLGETEVKIATGVAQLCQRRRWTVKAAEGHPCSDGYVAFSGL